MKVRPHHPYFASARPHRRSGDVGRSRYPPDMRFRSYVVFLRISGAAGIGVLLGCAIVGALHLLFGWVPVTGDWLLATPVLAVLGALVGLVVAALTRLWLMPSVRRRRLLGVIIGAIAVPLATSSPANGEPRLWMAVPAVLAGAAITTTLWIRNYRRETELLRQHLRSGQLR